MASPLNSEPGTSQSKDEHSELPTLLQGDRKNRSVSQDFADVIADEKKTAELVPERTSQEDADSDDEGHATTRISGDADAEDEEIDESVLEAARQRAADDEFFWNATQIALRERARREKVGAFLKAHGFVGVNSRRGWLWSYDYPLHCAAKHNDLEMVRILLQSKAIRRQKDSDNRTARAVAKKYNACGSHNDVVWSLTSKKRRAALQAKAAAAKNIQCMMQGARTGEVIHDLERCGREEDSSSVQPQAQDDGKPPSDEQAQVPSASADPTATVEVPVEFAKIIADSRVQGEDPITNCDKPCVFGKPEVACVNPASG